MATPVYSTVPIFNYINNVKTQTGTTTAVTLIDANGNYVINPSTGTPYLVPVGYTLEGTVARTTATSALLSSASSSAPLAADSGVASLTTASILATGTVASLFGYKTGGQYDLQRSFNGTSFNGTVDAFTPIASFDFGLACRASGLSLVSCEAGGGANNWLNSLTNPNVNTSGEYYNNPANVPNIKAGSNYFDALPSASSTKPVTVNSNDLATVVAGASGTDAFTLSNGQTIAVATQSLGQSSLINGNTLNASVLVDIAGNNNLLSSSLSAVVIAANNDKLTAGNGSYIGVAGGGDVLSASNATIAGSGLFALNTVTGTNNQFNLFNNASFNLSDGSINKFTTDGTTSILYEKYGTINLTPGATNVDLRGNNDNVSGGSQNHTIVEGLNNTYTGSGGEVDPGAGSSLTVSGQDVVSLASNVDLTASNCTLNMSMSGLIGDTILGSYNAFHDLGGFQATIGGTYNTGLTGADSLTWLGATTGDSTDGGSDTSNPDLYPPPPPPASDSGAVSDDDPIILSLNGAKVQTQNLTSSSAYFDIQNVGTSVHTGWGTAGEGYLVYDPTNKNTVTNEQSMVSSFAALKALDLNHDNVLNSLDAAWASMKVWVDSTGTGKFTAGSLKTMDQIGISSINLNSTHVNQNQNNNTILDDSTFSWRAGGTGDISGVDLNFHAASVITVTGGGGGGGGGCVQYCSWLPDGGRAGNMVVGSEMQLAHEVSLEPGRGTVTYSVRKTAAGFRIVAEGGYTLVCSDTAPIPTQKGLVLAPALFGHMVAVRKDEGGSSMVGWANVLKVDPIGPIEVQHITVGDMCFWAGENPHMYILHHNSKVLP